MCGNGVSENRVNRRATATTEGTKMKIRLSAGCDFVSIVVDVTTENERETAEWLDDAGVSAADIGVSDTDQAALREWEHVGSRQFEAV